MQNQDGTPPAEGAGGAPAEGAPAEGGGSPALPTQEQLEAHFSEGTPGDAGQDGGEGQPPEGQPPEGGGQPTPPEDDPDGDHAFENEFKDFKMPEGLKKRLAKLTEQRNTARDGLKGYGHFEKYNTDEGRQYVDMLVKFDGLMEQAAKNNPWFADVIKEAVMNGQKLTPEALGQLLGLAQGEAPVGGEGEGAGEGAGEAPQAANTKEYAELKARLDALDAEKQAASQETARRQAVDKEKEAYRKEIAAFEEANPDFKGDKAFIRLALQNSAARNISFTDAAKELKEYMGGREASKLQDLANAGKEREGAGVETPGRGGVPRTQRPAVGSDDERDAMLAHFGITDD